MVYSFFDVASVDHIALPHKGGAMENWGLITYGEYILLWDPDWSTTSSKFSVADVIAHELAHQVKRWQWNKHYRLAIFALSKSAWLIIVSKQFSVLPTLVFESGWVAVSNILNRPIMNKLWFAWMGFVSVLVLPGPVLLNILPMLIRSTKTIQNNWNPIFWVWSSLHIEELVGAPLNLALPGTLSHKFSYWMHCMLHRILLRPI